MFKILFGFEDSKIAVNNILGKLKSLGIPYETVTKYSKATIKDFLHNHPDYNVVILKETVGDTKYTAEELAELADEREINIIVVLGSEHKGQPYMQTLYSAGIVNAIFQEGRTGGGTVAGIVQLILQKRSRKEARAYYGIETVELGTLSNDMFAYYYLMLEDREYGMHLIERYLFVASKLSPLQNADFLRRLRKDYIGDLSVFQEFHQVLSAIKSVGVDIAKELKIKKPKRFTSIESLPHSGPLLEAKVGYTGGESVLFDTATSFDGYEDGDNGVFDFGFGELLAQEEHSVSTETNASVSPSASKERVLPAEEMVSSAVETLRVSGEMPVLSGQESIKSAKKPKREKKDKKIKKEKAGKQGVVQSEGGIESGEILSLEESTKRERKSFRWLLWAIPLALILLITITLITILIIYYVRY